MSLKVVTFKQDAQPFVAGHTYQLSAEHIKKLNKDHAGKFEVIHDGDAEDAAEATEAPKQPEAPKGNK
jgi:hypothetical protein